jgi:guanylate kinase
MAAEALRGEEVDGYDASFTTREDLMGPLDEALESSPPVDEAYYYSLTGRLETLAHALDILIEIERRKRDKLN